MSLLAESYKRMVGLHALARYMPRATYPVMGLLSIPLVTPITIPIDAILKQFNSLLCVVTACFRHDHINISLLATCTEL